jgi:hypothetical protein
MGLSLINLAIVAFFGLSLRTKFVFSVPFINYRYFLSAHSHFAFGGWVALSLMVLMTYQLLPEKFYNRSVYQWIFGSIELSSLGMVFTFPFNGYAAPSFTFSTLFLLAAFAFCGVFIKDLLKANQDKTVALLAIGGLASLVISTLGTLGITYVLVLQSSNSILYRDSLYFFLHFQYNGFFTLSIFSLLANDIIGLFPENDKRKLYRFALTLCLSIPPSLYLALLWHPGNYFFRSMAIIGCLLIIASLYYFVPLFSKFSKALANTHPIAKGLLFLSLLSFCLKMLLQMGTVFPELGQAVYGNRPIIIGFLHLVFLGLASFYILYAYIREGLFNMKNFFTRLSFYTFSIGVIFNEFFLMLQGLSMLFKSSHAVYPWLLWVSAIILFLGGMMMAISKYLSAKTVLPSTKDIHGITLTNS